MAENHDDSQSPHSIDNMLDMIWNQPGNQPENMTKDELREENERLGRDIENIRALVSQLQRCSRNQVVSSKFNHPCKIFNDAICYD